MHALTAEIVSEGDRMQTSLADGTPIAALVGTFALIGFVSMGLRWMRTVGKRMS